MTEMNGSGAVVNIDGEKGSLENEIFEAIAQLNEERMAHEAQGDFMQAARVKDRLQKLGEEFEKRKLNDLKNKHQNEKDALENEFQKELNSCTDFWGDKITQYNEQSQSLENELRSKHEENLESYQAKLEEQMPKVGKMSPEILNLEYQIQRLVKDQRYKEAHALQKKAEALRQKCSVKIDNETAQRRNHKIDHFLQKQDYEMQALCKKIDTGREELVKAKEKDYQKLVSKYRVQRENLDDSQILEYQKHLKTLKMFKPSSNLFNKSFQGESIQKTD